MTTGAGGAFPPHPASISAARNAWEGARIAGECNRRVTEGRNDGRTSTPGGHPTQARCAGPSVFPPFRLLQNLFEQTDRPRILALPQPEQRALPELTARAGARHPDEGRYPLVGRALGQGEHRLLPHFDVAPLVGRDRVEPARRRLAGRLPQPEHRLTPSLERERFLPGEAE